MEELRSTEILDKEIQEDARKKAEKILATADLESKAILENVSERIQSVRKEKETAYAQRLVHKQKDSAAAIPLEKERFLVSFEGRTVISAINEYLGQLDEKKQIVLLEKNMLKYHKVLENKKIKAIVFGLECSQVEPVIKKTFGAENILSCSSAKFEELGLEEPEGLNVHKGAILVSEDETVRCRVTFGEIVEEVLDDNSMELAQTLFCGRLPQ